MFFSAYPIFYQYINAVWPYCPFSPNYGTEYRLEIVDATTDNTVGTALLTTQGLLQEQRDLVVAQGGTPLLRILDGPVCFRGKRRLKLELRSGVRNGFSADFYITPRVSHSNPVDKIQKGK